MRRLVRGTKDNDYAKIKRFCEADSPQAKEVIKDGVLQTQHPILGYIKNFSLLNNRSLGVSQVFTIGFLDVEGAGPLGEVSGGHIDTEEAGAVDIHLQQGLVFRLCLLAQDA